MLDDQIRPNGHGGLEESSNENHETMESLMRSEDAGLEFPNQGEIRTGVIAIIAPSQILVSIGSKSEGVITGKELESIPQDVRNAFKVGQEIPVYIKDPEDEDGNVILSFTRARESMSWEVVEALQAKDNVINGRIDGYNKGGLIVLIEGLRGFVPSSQLSFNRRSSMQNESPDKWQKLIGETMDVKIIEIDRARRRLILSEKAANPEPRQSVKDKVLEDINEGDVLTGKVTSIADFGAFVNINGADGLVHLSEISWDRIKHPSEALEVGQDVKVKVLNVDKAKKRIGLSIRALLSDPWENKVAQYSVGQLVEGEITRLTKYGAFARIDGDLEGLIFISEMSENRIGHPKEIVKEGERLTLRIIKIDEEQKKIGLSLRKVDSGAFADLDMKALTAELTQEDEE
ncbi:MAG TPA: S1 RNA-binding domain-containing protein [Anaerolineales bacterium]|nr:S1 RNA-binding domain-containing protein [Anaerolineales bacterium]